MIPPEVKNPFHTHAADDTLTIPAGDVPELHADVLAKCKAALAQSRDSNHSVGMLVVGEAGSGKSHLIAQLRQQLAADPRAVLVAIRLSKAYSGRLWRHFRERLVEELLRQYPPPAPSGSNGLLRILWNRFPKWATAAQSAGGILNWLIGRSKVELRPHLEEFSKTCPLDYNLMQVLPQLGNAELTSIAFSWLQGKQLGDRDLQRLGLPAVHPSEQEQEIQAQDISQSLLRLAGEQTTLVACFDEVEAIQAGVWDKVVLRQFTTLATDLLAEAGPRVIVTCIRPQLQVELQKEVEHSNIQKISSLQSTIPNLRWEQTARIVRARLEAEPTCRVARAMHPHSPDWPFAEAFLQGLFQDNKRSLTPRHLIMACRLEFERIQKGKKADPPPGPGVKPPGPREPQPGGSSAPVRPDEFGRCWEKLRGKNLAKSQGILFDSVMAIALPWLVKLTETPFVWVQEQNHLLGDISLVFQPNVRGRKPLGVSFCNHPPGPLNYRLDRVKKQWQAGKGQLLGSLAVLRFKEERTTPKNDERLKGLQGAGVDVISVDRQQLAELAAFQTMLTKTLEGDLTRHGRPVEVAEYDSWAKANLSAAVKELFQVVFEPPAPRQPPVAPAPSLPTTGRAPLVPDKRGISAVAQK